MMDISPRPRFLYLVRAERGDVLLDYGDAGAVTLTDAQREMLVRIVAKPEAGDHQRLAVFDSALDVIFDNADPALEARAIRLSSQRARPCRARRATAR